MNKIGNILIAAGFILLTIVAVEQNLSYAKVLDLNQDLKNTIRMQDSIIELQKEEIKGLEETVIEREHEISFWGHILDQLATNHPAEANKIATEFGYHTEFK